MPDAPTDLPAPAPAPTLVPPAAPPLIDYLDTLVADLRNYLPDALERFETQAVHQARVATRRLAAALNILQPVLDRHDLRDFKKTLRKIRRRLGPHRDLDVLIAHVADLAPADLSPAEPPPAPSNAVDYLLRTLRARQHELRRKALEKSRLPRSLERLTAWESDVRPMLLAHAHAFPALVADGVHHGFDEFSALADLLAHQHGEGQGLGAIDPHELRIAGKLLRYSLELAVAQGQDLPPLRLDSGDEVSLLKTFKHLQDLLGDWHDRVVLSDTAVTLMTDKTLSHRDPVLAASILTLSASTLANAAKCLDDFSALWFTRGNPLATALRQTFLLTRDLAQESRPHPSEWPPGIAPLP